MRKCFADARCSPILQGEDDLDTAAMDPLIMSSPFSFGTRLATSLYDYPSSYGVKKLNIELQRLFSSSCRNLKLKEDFTNCLSELEAEIHTFLRPSPVQSSRQATNPPSEALGCTPWRVMLGQLLLDRSTPELQAPSRLQYCGPPGIRPSSDSDTHTLNQLFASLRMNETDPSFQKQYISRLHDSA